MTVYFITRMTRRWRRFVASCKSQYRMERRAILYRNHIAHAQSEAR